MSIPLARGFADFDNHVKTLCEAVGMVTSRIASVEQTDVVVWVNGTERQQAPLQKNVRSLTARICKIETNATSVSSGSGPARSWYILEHSNGSTANGLLGSHGPGSSIGPATIGEKSIIPAYNKPVRVSLQSRFLVTHTCIRNKSQVSGLCGPM